MIFLSFSPNSFSLSLQERCSSPLIILAAFHWTLSSMSSSLLYWGAENWTQYSMCGFTLLYMSSLLKHYLGHSCPYVLLPILHCPKLLLSERNKFQLFNYLQLRLPFYHGPKSTKVEVVSANLGHAFPIFLFYHLHYSSWCSMNWFSKLIFLKTSQTNKQTKSDGVLLE